MTELFKDQGLVGSYVRDGDGRVGLVIRNHESAYGYVIVQFDAFGKRRHKHRKTLSIGLIIRMNEMEVIAEASK